MVHPHDVITSPWTIRMIKLAEQLQLSGHTVELYYFIEPHRRAIGYEIACADQFPVDLTALHKYRLIRNIRQFFHSARNADIFHIQKCFAHVTLPVLATAFQKGIPVHYDWDDWEEGITMDYLDRRHPFARLVAYYETHLPALVDSISVASEVLKTKALELGFAEDRIVTVPVGADPDFFSPDTTPDAELELPAGTGPIVLYAGQLEGANYASLFIKAAALVLKKLPDTRFIVIGGGFTLPLLQKTAAELGLTHTMVFTDYVLHRRMPGILAHADICVATFEDNQITRCKSPLKIVEYMAMARPIVASAVGEVKTMLQSCGILVTPGSPEAIANELVLLLSDRARRLKLGLLARQAVETKYNWKVSADTLLDVYKRVLNETQA